MPGSNCIECVTPEVCTNDYCLKNHLKFMVPDLNEEKEEEVDNISDGPELKIPEQSSESVVLNKEILLGIIKGD